LIDKPNRSIDMNDKVKVPNYTDAQTAELVEAYKVQADQDARVATVREFAEKFGKSTRSIVAKLAREGVYVKKEYVTKKGEKVVRKAEYVTQIAKAIGTTEDQLNGLENATKATLATILKAVG